MTPEHEAHRDRILRRFSERFTAKYSAGQLEHGGKMWEKPGMLDHAIDEAVDLVCYLYTLKEQIEGRTDADHRGREEATVDRVPASRGV